MTDDRVTGTEEADSSEALSTQAARDHQDVHVLQLGDREILLVGTAHVSQASADLVQQIIKEERPDRVCVELDPQRYKALAEGQRWEQMDLREVIKEKRLPALIVSLMLASYQKKLGGKLGVAPGTELLEATRTAEELGIPFDLCDRNIRITLKRAWASMSLWQKNQFLASALAGVFDDESIDEAQLEELRKQDVLTEMMNELAKALPNLKEVLIDERDIYLAENIRSAKGQKIIAVVGAGHVAGMIERLENDEAQSLDALEVLPKSRPWAKMIAWGIPALVIAGLIYIAFSQGLGEAGENLGYWITINGGLAAIGAIAALAHPWTILAALVAAPITSLMPVIGAGYVTALVQAWVRPPRVKDFEVVTEDMGRFRAWWSNRLLKVFLALIFPTIGSLLGTVFGIKEIAQNAF